ncbi:MAG TPA: hypothetical protein VM911_02055 [Pyrinomonadaceae bacterium]|jgi:hypothetical protein|nr:hypothetical protein [Pyrinomonadaceae bacterium]
MKRAPDKIKDFVQPQAFDEVRNYTNDPSRSLAAYHFTDATSDLLGRWLDALADLPRNRGSARALAGLRGVGKSHTLAVFAALSAFPDLRQSVGEAHIAASAGRLLNRRYKVAQVERGTRATLMEELCAAFAATFGGTEVEWKDDPRRMLALAGSMSEGPLVLIIDTALGREDRVRRDDGPLLSELAEAATQLTAFVALALDDDIEGADGANVALSGAFQIDYLDPEHLYRIADLFLFRKTPRARAALHDFYVTLRAAVPSFNWNELRFTELYPVHPLVADIAHAVRLYAPRFAFLPFAAEAVARATNRPALSLVLLDEVFDKTEQELRRAEDLKDSFVAYDHLATHGVGALPVMQRLQAKLILKGLFVISLDGRGATARELSAAMLLYDQVNPQAIINQIEETLAFFARTAPQGTFQTSEEGGTIRYRFNVGRESAFETALAEAAQGIEVDATQLSAIFKQTARARFADWPFVKDGEEDAQEQSKEQSADFDLMWRGTPRRGRLSCGETNQSAQQTPDTKTTAVYDWEIQALTPFADLEKAAGSFFGNANAAKEGSLEREASRPRMIWQPATLSAEEKENLRRLIALRSSDALLDEYGETASAAERHYAALAERIWTRLYLDEGALLTGANHSRLAFTDEARSADTLAHALQMMLGQRIGILYPQHPVFTRALDESEVAQLVGGLFSGANQAEANVQELARLFAEPLGLASLRGGVYTLEVGDQALKQPWVREVIAMTDDADGEVVALHDIGHKLRSEPYGLLTEAQQLILAALVAQRRIELVTTTGDRITHRTLDRALRWNEIAGVARAATLLHSAGQLTAWASLLTDKPQLATISSPEARAVVREALSVWLEEWRGRRLLEKFDALPDESLTLSAWELSVAVRKSFESAAESIEALLSGNITLEEALQRIADDFGDSTEGFAERQRQLAQFVGFTEGLVEREQARTYLSLAEPTTEEEIESARRELLMLADDARSLFDANSRERFQLLWREFQARYIEHYAAAHASAFAANVNQQEVLALLRSDDWREFEALSQLTIVNRTYWDKATDLIDRARAARCQLPVDQLLMDRPYCACSFRLAPAITPQLILPWLADVMRRGCQAHRHTLTLWARSLSQALSALTSVEKDQTSIERARHLVARFSEDALPDSFTWVDARLVERALSFVEFTEAEPSHINPPLPAPVAALPVSESEPIMEAEPVAARPEQWLDNLPGNPTALFDAIGESGRNAD